MRTIFLALVISFIVSIDTSGQDVFSCSQGELSCILRPDYPHLDQRGPYFPGERISFTYDLTFKSDLLSEGNNCQWLQGIIPSLGMGWDLNVQPISDQDFTSFMWFEGNEVDLNVDKEGLDIVTNGRGELEIIPSNDTIKAGALLPAGWWFTSAGQGPNCTNDGDPDNMWGMPMPCGDQLGMTFVFDLVVKSEESDYINDPDYLKIEFYTFSDGMTGCAAPYVCADDIYVQENFGLSSESSCLELDAAAVSTCNVLDLNGLSDTHPDLLCLRFSFGNPPPPPNQHPTLCDSLVDIEYVTWYSFIAGSESLEISFADVVCSSDPNEMSGIQVGLYEDCLESNCIASDLSCDGHSDKLLKTDNLEVGSKYFIFVVGCTDGDCDYTIRIEEGEEFIMPQPLSLTPAYCDREFYELSCDNDTLAINCLVGEPFSVLVTHDGSSPNENLDQFCDLYPVNVDATFVWSIDPPLSGIGDSFRTDVAQNGFVFPEVDLPQEEGEYQICLEEIVCSCCDDFETICMTINLTVPFIEGVESICVGEVDNVEVVVFDNDLDFTYELEPNNNNLNVRSSIDGLRYDIDVENAGPGEYCFDLIYGYDCNIRKELYCFEIIEDSIILDEINDIYCETEMIIIDSEIDMQFGSVSWDFDGMGAVEQDPDGRIIVTDLLPGQYFISAEATTEFGCSVELTKEVIILERLLPPLVTCNSNEESIDIIWDLVVHAQEYLLEYSIDGMGAFQETLLGQEFALSGLLPESCVDFTLTAVSGTSCPNVSSTITCCSQLDNDVDNDGVTSDVDCDDNDPNNYPGNQEVCDNQDNDCDGEIDEGLVFVTYYYDMDGDGYGNSTDSIVSCMELENYVLNNEDCDDTNFDISPDAMEIPNNGVDENCDGEDVIVSVNELDHNLVIYPNPVASILFVEYNEDINWVYEIFDVSGKLALNGETSQVVNLKEISGGVYILKLTSPVTQESVIRRIIKL